MMQNYNGQPAGTQDNPPADPGVALARDMQERWPQVRDAGAGITRIEQRLTAIDGAVASLQRSALAVPTGADMRRLGLGGVSLGLARTMGAMVVLLAERTGMLADMCESHLGREACLDFARGALGITVKTALSTTEIPLPATYGAEVGELIAAYGVARKRMSMYPIGKGTAKPARMGTRPAFGSVAMSGAIPERSPTLTFASLESHKVGGLVRVPRELDEQSIVPLGAFVARYAATEFAKAEDTWAFLADGSGTYETVKGLVQIATDNSKTITTATGKTAPSDITLANLRALRTEVSSAVLTTRGSAYYMHPTWDTFLPTLNTDADPFAYVRRPDGTATLDGYPVVWVDVLTPYGTAAAPAAAMALFGSLSHWWFGEHGSPRIDMSSHVFFANDQVAIRCIEEIDFDYMAVDAVAALLTAAE